MRLCGSRLLQVVMALCEGTVRHRRHAVPEPVYPGSLSPYLMSVYRPSIDDDMTITDGNWEQESNPVRERFQHIQLLGVISYFSFLVQLTFQSVFFYPFWVHFLILNLSTEWVILH